MYYDIGWESYVTISLDYENYEFDLPTHEPKTTVTEQEWSSALNVSGMELERYTEFDENGKMIFQVGDDSSYKKVTDTNGYVTEYYYEKTSYDYYK